MDNKEYINSAEILFDHIREGKLTEKQFIENFDFIVSVSRTLTFSTERGYETPMQMLNKYCKWFSYENMSDSVKAFMQLRGHELPDHTAGGKIRWI
jgi:hypothetical protein